MRWFTLIPILAVLIIGCGDEEYFVGGVPAGGSEPAQNSGSGGGDSTFTDSAEVADTRRRVLEVVESSKVELVRALPSSNGYLPGMEQDIAAAYDEMKEKIRGYRAYSPSQLVAYAKSELNKLENRVSSGAFRAEYYAKRKTAPTAKAADADGFCTDEFKNDVKALANDSVDIMRDLLAVATEPDFQKQVQQLRLKFIGKCDAFAAKYGADATCKDKVTGDSVSVREFLEPLRKI
jgi:hypothetical protein